MEKIRVCVTFSGDELAVWDYVKQDIGVGSNAEVVRVLMNRYYRSMEIEADGGY